MILVKGPSKDRVEERRIRHYSQNRRGDAAGSKTLGTQ